MSNPLVKMGALLIAIVAVGFLVYNAYLVMSPPPVGVRANNDD